MRSAAVVATAALVLLPATLSSHGGGLDRNGCHTNRSTGVYHCHGSSSAPAPVPRSVPRSSAPSSATTGVQPLSGAGSIAVATPAPAIVASQRDLVLTAQTLLQALGYQVGVDGIVGPTTTVAVQRFQRSASRQADGKISGQLLVDLAQRVRARMAG